MGRGMRLFFRRTEAESGNTYAVPDQATVSQDRTSYLQEHRSCQSVSAIVNHDSGDPADCRLRMRSTTGAVSGIFALLYLGGQCGRPR